MLSKRILSFARVFTVFFFPALGLDFLLFQITLNLHQAFNVIASIAFIVAFVRAIYLSFRKNADPKRL